MRACAAIPQSSRREIKRHFAVPIELERHAVLQWSSRLRSGWLARSFRRRISKIGSSYASGQVAADLLTATADYHLYHNEGEF
jgi:hypothetical protein